MMLLAHGDTQSDDLQTSSGPKSAIPAFGYGISQNRVGRHSCRERRGDSGHGRWSRHRARIAAKASSIGRGLGEYFPLSRGQQHFDRTRTAMAGVVADGLLARFSDRGRATLPPPARRRWKALCRPTCQSGRARSSRRPDRDGDGEKNGGYSGLETHFATGRDRLGVA